MGTVNVTNNSNTVVGIGTAWVQAVSSAVKDAGKQAEALLRNILSGERTRTDAAEALAFARSELASNSLFLRWATYLGASRLDVGPGIGSAVISEMLAVPLGTARVTVVLPHIPRQSPEGQRFLNDLKIVTISLKR